MPVFIISHNWRNLTYTALFTYVTQSWSYTWDLQVLSLVPRELLSRHTMSYDVVCLISADNAWASLYSSLYYRFVHILTHIKEVIFKRMSIVIAVVNDDNVLIPVWMYNWILLCLLLIRYIYSRIALKHVIHT